MGSEARVNLTEKGCIGDHYSGNSGIYNCNDDDDWVEVHNLEAMTFVKALKGACSGKGYPHGSVQASIEDVNDTEDRGRRSNNRKLRCVVGQS